MKNKIFSLLLLIPVLFVGCDDLFDKGDVEKTYDGPDQLAFFPLEDNNNLSATNTSTTIQVQLISADGVASSDIAVNFSANASSTARAGTDYSFATPSPITISAGEATADITVNFVVTTINAVAVTGAADADSFRVEADYSGLAATGGSGTGATFDVSVDADGVATVTVATGGTGYASADTFTITDANLGGGGAPDLTFAVSDLTGSFTAGEVLLTLDLGDTAGFVLAENLKSSNVFMAK
ncbi:MAG: hypothetical protein RLN81_06910 [Balneolaceae bacterium]